MSVTRKRFIAGGICPQCNALDTLAIWRENQIEVVACVQCAYTQRQCDEPTRQHLRPHEQMIGIFHPE